MPKRPAFAIKGYMLKIFWVSPGQISIEYGAFGYKLGAVSFS
jgi:hypothetical protein